MQQSGPGKLWYGQHRALCFVETETDLGGEITIFSYINRSVSFAVIGMFDKSLLDIDLAIKAKYLSDQAKNDMKENRKFFEKITKVVGNRVPWTFTSIGQQPFLCFNPDLFSCLIAIRNMLYRSRRFNLKQFRTRKNHSAPTDAHTIIRSL